MMMKRVSAFPTSQNYQGQPEYDLTLHLLLDEKGYPIGKWPTFGNFGSMKNDPDEATEPFILFPNGTMDLGSPNEDLIDRYSKMTLLDGRPVVTERFFEVTYEGKVITYRITQIVDLHPEVTRVFHRELTRLKVMFCGLCWGQDMRGLPFRFGYC